MIAGDSGGATMDCVRKGDDTDGGGGTTTIGCKGKDGTNGGGMKDDETKALGDVADVLRGEINDEVVARYSS